MLPKAFLASDLGRELAEQQAHLLATRKRLEATEHAIEAMRRRLDALRKRVERSAEKRRKQQCHSEQGTQQPLEH
jgi:septal ring factor EnvC (AmiA/AmiB activator)